MKKYQQYSALDFINDPAFTDAYKSGASGMDNFQEKVLTIFPDRKPEFDLAKAMLAEMLLVNDKEDEAETMLINKAIESRLGLHEIKVSGETVAKQVHIEWYQRSVFRYAVAASISLVVSAAIWMALITGGFSEKRIVTLAGERKTIQLPDGSVAILNHNSELKYKTGILGEFREVWLQGEAFFTVSKIKKDGQAIKFIVHANNADAVVKGTRFNVRTRAEQTEIMLEEGRVDVVPQLNPEKAVVLTPGHLASLRKTEQSPTIGKASVLANTGWKSDKVILNNTPIKEVAEMIYHNFGKTLVFADSVTASKKLGGTINSENLPLLLQALTKITETVAAVKTDSVILKQVLTH